MKRLVLLAITGLLAMASPAVAAPQDIANDISEHIMSPFCPGVTLHDCPSDSAVDLRDRITAMAEQGFTRAQIMAKLLDEYGESIRAEPTGGSGLVAWILPALAAIGGGYVAWRFLRGWAHEPAHQEGDAMSPSDRVRIDAELDDLRGNA
ncbi:MAG: cytochrome c-type biosis protein CcmH [Actinomycetota bacterium]|jgi:cytochrome c-type biogenesis protein CcmH|nr:cytochrome c-type biosis protein CcmH [Actinomycetota bacterium]